ncbi:HNH endonuclease [Acetobacter thailandicus]|uniref:HNH endonuclease n=1 Tax=Acetobacter thailandicus TaxID=1502842 RepID=UPI001BA862FF|nr:HNH endonuclease [Acetobacter thailandicus]MBS0960224.1 HNH endonuclease [Acetobacter thailandicus]
MIERSFELVLVGYYLSRFTQRETGKPPQFLHCDTWQQAYDIFYEQLNGGRDRDAFKNSLKNTRDHFDAYFDNGREGWKDATGTPRGLSQISQSIYSDFSHKSENEIHSLIIALIEGAITVPTPTAFYATEGKRKVVISSVPERKPKLRAEAIRIHGAACQACGFDFSKTYGAWGAGFAEVHHSIPLAEYGTRDTDPNKDLTVLCANCHRMVHREPRRVLSLAELRLILMQG